MQDDLALQDRIRNLSNEELVEMVKRASEYQSEVISYAQEELSRRGGLDAINKEITICQQHEEEKRREGYANQPLFLHIPISRLIALSIISLGLYELYWMYKNWSHLKERLNLDIRPFARALFGVFYCHNLLRRIHEDNESRSIEMPPFSPRELATGWVALMMLSTMVGRIPGITATIISAFLPSFLFLVPVQNYVNSVNRRRIPGQSFYRWSAGHVLCVLCGVTIWALLLVGLGNE